MYSGVVGIVREEAVFKFLIFSLYKSIFNLNFLSWGQLPPFFKMLASYICMV